MRTIRITDEQVTLISQALGIAEVRFTKIHNDILSDTLHVRKRENDREQTNNAMFYHDFSCKFGDLNCELLDGKLDT